jgi:hypothetical protein
MTMTTALKISGLCLLALGAEVILAYFLFSSYAFSLVKSGRYAMPEAYSSGPMGSLATLFYMLFGVTATAGIAAPLISLLSTVVRRSTAGGRS